MPSDKIPDHGPCPVNAMLNCVAVPEQIVALPLICPVGISQKVIIIVVASEVAEQPLALATVTV